MRNTENRPGAERGVGAEISAKTFLLTINQLLGTN